MLTVYLDDSGTSPNQEIAVVAGYLGSVIQWERFNKRWKALLSKYGIARMHRVDLENFQGEFKNWTPDRRKEFLKKAHSIIRQCTYVAVGNSVRKADFDEAIPKENFVKKVSGIYGWCAQACIVSIYRWCKRYNYEQPIQFFFEAGTRGQGQVQSMFEHLYGNESYRQKWHIAGWSFHDKSLMPLQAADFIAYEYYKLTENQVMSHGKRPVRLSARDLFREHETEYFRYWGKAEFKTWLQNWNNTMRVRNFQS